MSKPLISEEMRTAALLTSHSQPTRTAMVNAILAAVTPLIVARCAGVAKSERDRLAGDLLPYDTADRIFRSIRALLETPDA